MAGYARSALDIIYRRIPHRMRGITIHLYKCELIHVNIAATIYIQVFISTSMHVCIHLLIRLHMHACIHILFCAMLRQHPCSRFCGQGMGIFMQVRACSYRAPSVAASRPPGAGASVPARMPTAKDSLNPMPKPDAKSKNVNCGGEELSLRTRARLANATSRDCKTFLKRVLS